MKVTRRDFLKWSGSGALALTVLPAFDQRAIREFTAAPAQVEAVGILVDTTRCIGCRLCQAACKKKNHLPDDGALQMPYGETYPKKLSATTFTNVEFYPFGGTDDALVFAIAKKQ